MNKLIVLFLGLFIACNSPVNIPVSEDENVHPIIGKWCKAVPNEYHPWMNFSKDGTLEVGDKMGFSSN